MEVEKTSSNIIDAAAAGAGDGLKLALNIGAMLLAFIALIALLNAPLTWIGEVTGLAACHRQADQPVDHLRLRAGPDRLGDRYPVG